MRATVVAHKSFTIGTVDGRVYGAFLEHLGRAVYSGIYEPDHPTADADGMRGDVAQLVRDLNVPLVRYPGGNFVSQYDWEDGIGPKEQRPVRLDLAWYSSESNHVGIHEFAKWCQTVNSEMMLAVNLGSRGLSAARNLLEYTNHPGGTYWSDLRIKNGQKEPWNVRHWCLGNEMDGDWQVGHKKADEYGELAANTARAMRKFDPTLELIVCGSSNAEMPSLPDWERIVLEHTYEHVNYISLHMYFGNKDKNTANYLALNTYLDRYIETIAATIRLVKGKKRSRHDVHISFDEWNVWYHSREHDREFRKGNTGWPFAPSLLEDIYNFEDVLQVGCVINTFIRRADVVKIACIAQLVNVIAPIMTERGGPAWRQTIYYPYYFASRYGRGTALRLAVDCPGYDSKHDDNVPYLDVSGVHDEDAEVLTFFLVNRHTLESIESEISLEGFSAGSIIDHQAMSHADLEAANTALHPTEVAPRPGSGAQLIDGKLLVRLLPLSYQMIRIKL